MAQDSDVKLGQLARYIFTAPSWQRSLFLIVILGFLIDGAGVRAWVILPFSALPFSGTLRIHDTGACRTCPDKANH